MRYIWHSHEKLVEAYIWITFRRYRTSAGREICDRTEVAISDIYNAKVFLGERGRVPYGMRTVGT